MWLRKDEYIDQLIFVNKKISDLIDILLKKSSNPPIIIIQSDHGPQVLNVPTNDYLESRLSILNLYYFPNMDKSILYDSITPVNTFRILFKNLFNADIDLLPDKSYFSQYNKPYQFKLIYENEKK